MLVEGIVPEGGLRRGAYTAGMSAYVTRRIKVVSDFAREHAVSQIRAGELATAWEYEGNRRGLDQRQREFWDTGRTWMAEQLAARRENETPPA